MQNVMMLHGLQNSTEKWWLKPAKRKKDDKATIQKDVQGSWGICMTCFKYDTLFITVKDVLALLLLIDTFHILMYIGLVRVLK
jgi:hypothetical protein